MKILIYGKTAFDKLIEFMLFVLMSAMFVFVTWQVVSRYVLNDPSSWSEEAARYCMIWVAMLGSAVALKRGMHMSLTLITDRMNNPTSKKLVIILGHLGCLIVGVIMIKFGYKYALSGLVKKAASFRMKMVWVNSSVFVGGICVVLNAMECIFKLALQNIMPNGEALIKSNILDAAERTE